MNGSTHIQASTAHHHGDSFIDSLLRGIGWGAGRSIGENVVDLLWPWGIVAVAVIAVAVWLAITLGCKTKG